MRLCCEISIGLWLHHEEAAGDRRAGLRRRGNGRHRCGQARRRLCGSAALSSGSCLQPMDLLESESDIVAVSLLAQIAKNESILCFE